MNPLFKHLIQYVYSSSVTGAARCLGRSGAFSKPKCLVSYSKATLRGEEYFLKRVRKRVCHCLRILHAARWGFFRFLPSTHYPPILRLARKQVAVSGLKERISKRTIAVTQAGRKELCERRSCGKPRGSKATK